MENTFISHEFEEMRSQISILKDKLEKQAIVNETHIRNSMKSKASDINRIVTVTIVLGVFALVYPAWFFHTQGLSLAFIAATVVMMAVCLTLTIVQRINLGKLDFSKGNLLQTAQVLGKLRIHYKEWWKIAVPMLVIWFSWMMYEFITIQGMSPLTMGFCCGAGVGVIIGGIIGIRTNRKVVRKANEILDQIEELQKGE